VPGGLRLLLSPHVLRWLAAAGASGAFVAGISAQAIGGHGSAPTPSTDRVRAAISDLSPVPPAPDTPALRGVTVPALSGAPRPQRHRSTPVATPAPPVLVAATPTPAPTQAPVISAPPTVKPASPTRGPNFDSTG
jgi:hypothetical protein